MEKLIEYFDQIPSLHRALILAGGLTFFLVLEQIIPFFRIQFKWGKHLFINLFFTFTTVLINFLFAGLIVWVSDYCIENGFGLLQWTALSGWTLFFVGIAGLDFIGAYLPHWVEHKLLFFWRFHIVHHTDPAVDTSTANRHHPLESVIRAVFTLIGVAILGAPIWLLMAYQSISVVLSQFNHANIALPKKIDRILSWVIVSPDMHKVHHHYKLPYTDSNYGNIFSIWDRLLNTYTYMPDRRNLVYGLDTYSKKEEHSRFSFLLKQPFLPYRKPEEEDIEKVEIDN